MKKNVFLFTIPILVILIGLIFIHFQKWSPSNLEKSVQIDFNHSIKTSIIEQTSDSITIEFSNHSLSEWVYGEYYTIEIFMNDEWYQVPWPDGYAVHDIAYIVSPFTSSNQSYSLSIYDLIPGTYRIIVENTATVFTIQ